MSNDILVFGEQLDGVPHRIAAELICGAATLAQGLGGGVTGITLGRGAREAALGLAPYGASRVCYVADSDLSDYGVHAQAHVLAQVVRAQQPAAVLLPATNDGRDVAARLAAILETGILCNATRLYVQEGRVVSEQAAFDGALLISCVTRGSGPALVTVRGKAFTAEKVSGSESPVEEFACTLSDDARTVRVLEVVRQESGEAVPLETADIIVAAGRGVGGPDGLQPVRALAHALGGAFAVSRAVVDAGWAPYALQVGQTGKTVKPKAYIAVGISGAIQHKVGMQDAGAIIAINKDRDAAIFAFADLGIVGDLKTIVPRLTEEIEKRR